MSMPFSRPGAVDLSGLKRAAQAGPPNGPSRATARGVATQGAGDAGRVAAYSFEVDEQNFQQVLEASMTAPVLLVGGYKGLAVHLDRFVITNMRVFRIKGVLAQSLATMPLTRILDITVQKPLLGRLLGYGHFVFESAAQVQGLNVIRYVADIDEREDALRMIMAPDSPVLDEDEATDDGT